MNRRPVFTDQEILDRSRSVFLERGYTARTRQLASAVGLTWGAIALRFGNKRSADRRSGPDTDSRRRPPSVRRFASAVGRIVMDGLQ